MKSILLLLFIISSLQTEAQNTNVDWIKNIDTTKFQVYYNKKEIPGKLLSYLETSRRKVGNPDQRLGGCMPVHGTYRRRLNWVAKDSENHFVVSFTTGGYGKMTSFYFVDFDSHKVNINQIIFESRSGDSKKDSWSLGVVTSKLVTNEYQFGKYYP